MRGMILGAMSLWAGVILGIAAAFAEAGEGVSIQPQAPPPDCSPQPLVFFEPKQRCPAWWHPDSTGMPATLSFFPADSKIVTVVGNPVTLPIDYPGPFPPAAKYIAKFVAGKKAGVTTVQVLATHPDGSSQYYNTWTIHNRHCGDERDEIIAEYRAYDVNLTPACEDFTQTVPSTAPYTFDKYNIHNNYGWALIREPLTRKSGDGLRSWVVNIKLLLGAKRPVNSAYRAPKRNKKIGGAAQSRHMYGDAIDLRNVTRTLAEYEAMRDAANVAGADYIEPWIGPCKDGCVHADWRSHSGGYSH